MSNVLVGTKHFTPHRVVTFTGTSRSGRRGGTECPLLRSGAAHVRGPGVEVVDYTRVTKAALNLHQRPSSYLFIFSFVFTPNLKPSGVLQSLS